MARHGVEGLQHVGPPLGQIAFADERKGAPWEPDTKEEARLAAALSRHVLDNVPLSPGDAEAIRGFLKKGWYGEVFKEPEVDTVYRGMSVPLAWLKKATGMTTAEIRGSKSGRGTVEARMKYTPRKGASSWSTSKTTARDFSVRGGVAEYGIVMHAAAGDNPGRFVIGKGGLYRVEPLDDYASEKEAVGLGTIRVYKIDWREL